MKQNLVSTHNFQLIMELEADNKICKAQVLRFQKGTTLENTEATGIRGLIPMDPQKSFAGMNSRKSAIKISNMLLRRQEHQEAQD